MQLMFDLTNIMHRHCDAGRVWNPPLQHLRFLYPHKRGFGASGLHKRACRTNTSPAVV